MRLSISIAIVILALSSASASASTWTVLVYMAADNSLREEALDDLAELEEVGSTTEVRVVVQIDLRGSTAKRFFVERGGSRLIGDLGDLDSGDPQALADFGIWGVLRYPSDHYMLILWDHGNGWFNELGQAAGYRSQTPPTVPTAIGYDCSSGNSIGVANGELSHALSEVAFHAGRSIDIFGLDACSMQLVEVAYEAKDAAQILVGSEQLVPLDGWPYNEILSVLTSGPHISPEELAGLIVETYVGSYSGGSQGNSEVTLSAVDLSRMQETGEAFEIFTDRLSERANEPFIQYARGEVQTFYMGLYPPFLVEDYIDLTHYARLIGQGSSGELRQAAFSLTYAIDGLVISNGHTGDSLQNACGLAVWYPEAYLSFINNYLDYKDLGLAESTAWEEFLYKSYGVDDTIPPTIPELASIGLFSANSFVVRWEPSYDLSGVSSYELRELFGVSTSFSDDCENDTTPWTLQGFLRSGGSYHSPSHSYFSHQGEMATKEPIDVSSGGEIRFWCCFRGRQSTDFLVVETSRDGANWQALDSLTGTEPDWVEKRYDLSLHAGAPIYVRFRYESDAAPERWVYIDDIEVRNFDRVEVVSSDIETDFYPVMGKEKGIYHYQVRAEDPFGNLSSWCEYGTVQVSGLSTPYSYPNPFGTGGTTIELEVKSEKSKVSLKIYDIAGRLVRTLLDESLATDHLALTTALFWDGENGVGERVAPGVYFYVVSEGSDTRTGKAVCIE